MLPLQAPLAVHDVAFVLDQLSVLLRPLTTLAGFALSVTVGAGVPGVIVTVTDLLALPPALVQVSVEVPVAVKLVRIRLPEAALVPVQAPEAVHDVAFVLPQLRVEEPPELTEIGLALNVTVGSGAGGGGNVDEVLNVAYNDQ